MDASLKVSVIIPNYNHARYLRQRIDTVLNQTYQNLEVVILDDNSTDDSVTVIRQYEGHPLVKTIILNKKNSGSPFRQWQQGLQQTEGEWVWIAESDDYADHRFVEKMIQAIEKVPGIGLAYCDSNVVNELEVSALTFAALKNNNLNTNRWSEDYTNSGMDEIENYLLPFGTVNNTSAVLFNKKILMEANPFDIDLRFIGDKYAFVKVLAKSNVVYVKDSLNYYRNPFAQKHFDKFLLYFSEHFQVFNWVYRDLNTIDKKKFFSAFYANTRNSMFRDWSMAKLRIYLKLFRLNPTLFIKNMAHSLSQSSISISNSLRQSLGNVMISKEATHDQ